MAILVTGGAGYIGSHTCVEILNAGYEIVIVDNFYNSCPEALNRIKELTGKDWFMTFPDFDSYLKAREKAYADYEDRIEWAEKMLVNIAKAGYFSSDRTIAEYNKDIWKL